MLPFNQCFDQEHFVVSKEGGNEGKSIPITQTPTITAHPKPQCCLLSDSIAHKHSIEGTESIAETEPYPPTPANSTGAEEMLRRDVIRRLPIASPEGSPATMKTRTAALLVAIPLAESAHRLHPSESKSPGEALLLLLLLLLLCSCLWRTKESSQILRQVPTTPHALWGRLYHPMAAQLQSRHVHRV